MLSKIQRFQSFLNTPSPMFAHPPIHFSRQEYTLQVSISVFCRGPFSHRVSVFPRSGVQLGDRKSIPSLSPEPCLTCSREEPKQTTRNNPTLLQYTGFISQMVVFLLHCSPFPTVLYCLPEFLFYFLCAVSGDAIYVKARLFDMRAQHCSQFTCPA